MMTVPKDNLETLILDLEPLRDSNTTSIITNNLLIKKILEDAVHTH